MIKSEDEMKSHQKYLSLHRHIATLPLKYQEVITLRFFEKKKIGEIEKIVGKKEGTVKSLLHRGLESLKKSLNYDATFLLINEFNKIGESHGQRRINKQVGAGGITRSRI